MKVVVVGPTGVGKSALSIELAKYLNAEVINADATQIYKELNIGSAKITSEEMDGVKHHLIDIKTPNNDYSVKEYQSDIRNIIDNSNKNYVIVGGTGLYIMAGLFDYRFYEDEVNFDLSCYSNDELYEMALKYNDKDSIDKNNRVRLERMVRRGSRKPVEPVLLYPDTIFIGLTTSREILYERINNRVDKMFEMGLISEVKDLLEKYPNSNILKRAIGYKEVIEYLNNEKSLDEVKNDIKKNSRHYAKRQYTWFNNKMDVKWFDVNFLDFEKTVKEVENYINSCHNS